MPEDITIRLQNFSFIISANCFKNVLFEGKQLYGFDTLIEAYKKLTASKLISNSVLVLVDPSNTMKEFVNTSKNNFEISNNNQILFIGRYLDFSSLVKKSNVVVRPTRSDGDALTVREALHFDVPIIASDCSVRPEGTIISKVGDHNDLSKKIYSVYSNEIKASLYKKENFNERILNNYRLLTNKKNKVS